MRKITKKTANLIELTFFYNFINSIKKNLRLKYRFHYI